MSERQDALRDQIRADVARFVAMVNRPADAKARVPIVVGLAFLIAYATVVLLALAIGGC